MSSLYSGESQLSSATCPRCGNSILGPVLSLDDVKWFIGDMAFKNAGKHGEPISYENFLSIWKTATDSIEQIALSEEIRLISESASEIGCYTEHMRGEIRSILDRYDAISSGSRKMMEGRSHLPNFLRQICYPEIDAPEEGVYNREPEPEPGDSDSGCEFPPVIYKNGKCDEFHET